MEVGKEEYMVPWGQFFSNAQLLSKVSTNPGSAPFQDQLLVKVSFSLRSASPQGQLLLSVLPQCQMLLQCQLLTKLSCSYSVNYFPRADLGKELTLEKHKRTWVGTVSGQEGDLDD